MCTQGKPCSCGYTPEQCAIHCTSSSSARNQYTSGYVLPVRYDTDGDYVVYELPADGSEQQYAQRMRRQASDVSDTASKMTTAITDLVGKMRSSISSDSNIKARFNEGVERIRNRMSSLKPSSDSNNDDGEGAQVGASLKFDDLKEGFKNGAEAVVKKIKDLTTKVSTRRRREATTQPGKMPVLRVKEYESNRGKNDDYSKYLTQSRVELPSNDKKEWNDQKESNDKETVCHQCGSKVTESVCRRCGSHQPQYIEYIQGKAVSYYPGAVRSESNEKTNSKERRYVYDRLGQKYLVNNDKLRLITPHQYESMVSDQPDYSGLAAIMNEKKEVIREMNPVPGRVMNKPDQLAIDALALIRDMSLRSAAAAAENHHRNNNNRENKQEKRSADQNKWQHEYQQKTENRGAANTATTTTTPNAEQKWNNDRSSSSSSSWSTPPRSMYQVVPMQYGGRDGKLVVKVYSSSTAKPDQTNPVYQKYNDERRSGPSASGSEYIAPSANSELTTPSTKSSETYKKPEESWKVHKTSVQSSDSDASKPIVRKFTKNNKEYEILSFQDYKKDSSDEDVRHILEHLHGKQLRW